MNIHTIGGDWGFTDVAGVKDDMLCCPLYANFSQIDGNIRTYPVQKSGTYNCADVGSTGGFLCSNYPGLYNRGQYVRVVSDIHGTGRPWGSSGGDYPISSSLSLPGAVNTEFELVLTSCMNSAPVAWDGGAGTPLDCDICPGSFYAGGGYSGAGSAVVIADVYSNKSAWVAGDYAVCCHLEIKRL